MPSPDQATAAHKAIHTYRAALDDAKRHADALATAARNAGQAAAALRGFVTSPLPAIEWDGAPPVAEWIAALDTIIPEVKAALQA